MEILCEHPLDHFGCSLNLHPHFDKQDSEAINHDWQVYTSKLSELEKRAANWLSRTRTDTCKQFPSRRSTRRLYTWTATQLEVDGKQANLCLFQLGVFKSGQNP